MSNCQFPIAKRGGRAARAVPYYLPKRLRHWSLEIGHWKFPSLFAKTFANKSGQTSRSGDRQDFLHFWLAIGRAACSDTQVRQDLREPGPVGVAAEHGEVTVLPLSH